MNSLRVQHDLSKHLALLQILMRSPNLLQRKSPINDGLEPPRKHMPKDFMQFAHRAHVRTQQRQLSRKKKTQVEINFRPGSRAASHKRPSGFQRSHTFLPGCLAYVLDDDVRSFGVSDLADLLRDFLLIMIDDEVGAKLAGALHFAIVARCSYYPRMKQFRNLDGGDPHSRICAQHKNSLTGADSGPSRKHVPRGDKYQRHAGRLIEIERVGNRNDVDSGRGKQFAVAAIHAIAQDGKIPALILQSGNALRTVIAEMHGRNQDALADFKIGNILAQFDDLPSHIAAHDVRQVHSRQPAAHEYIEMIHGARAHPDQDLILARLRIRNIFVGEDFGSAELMDAYGFHESSCRNEFDSNFTN